MPDYWLIRAGRSGELWSDWEEKDIITIGWDVGDVAETKPDWDDMKEMIVTAHNPDDPGGTTGQIRRLVGLRSSDADNIKEGDIAIVEGNATVAGVARIGEYRYESDGLTEAPSHTYWRDVEYLHSGPVRIRDLPSRFHQGEENSLHLVSTLKKYKSGSDDVVDELLQALDEAEEVQKTSGFIDFSEASIQSYLEGHLEEILPTLSSVEREYGNTAGYADFVCELDSSDTVVIETKIGTAGHSAVSQLMSYMNALRDERKGSVSGMVVAEDFSTKAKLAAQSDEIDLYRFEAKLEFSQITG